MSETIDATIILIVVVMIPFLFMANWMSDGTDRKHFCNSILPLDTFENYSKNKLENEYCYKHTESYGYEDRYFDIPPRDFN